MPVVLVCESNGLPWWCGVPVQANIMTFLVACLASCSCRAIVQRFCTPSEVSHRRYNAKVGMI